MQDVSNYNKIREDAKKFYAGVGKIFCPAFNQAVSFGSEGFNHLIYKGDRRERDKGVQIMKFKLLPLAVKLLKLTTTYQEFEETLQEIQMMRFKKRSWESVVVRYWGIIAVIDNRKLKVIVRQLGDNGNKHFWSVIPGWITNQYRDIKLVSTMKGNSPDD